MSNRLIEKLSDNTTVTKPRLVKTINAAVDEINTIHGLYDKFFASEGDKQSLAQQIEAQLQAIKDKHSELFGIPEGGVSQVKQLDQKIEEIKEFHQKLVTGEASIKQSVAESQAKITAFYTQLFQTYAKKGDGGQEAILKKAFESITAFNDTLNKADVGYKATIENAKNEILNAHKELFAKAGKGTKSKVDLLNEQVSETGQFHDKITTEIAPFIEEKHKSITTIADDIAVKQVEIDNLLSKATVRSLSQGYMEAMQIYGDPVYGSAKNGRKNQVWHALLVTSKAIKHFAKFIGGYTLFIGPLVLIGLVFVSDGNSIFSITQDGTVQFSGTEYIAYKLTIALPLLWVSWFGQRNISHRKRLFEEYNHKLRVVQMYLQFLTKSSSYQLNDKSRAELEKILMATISKNPAVVYEKGDTFIDKILSIFTNRHKSDKTLPEALTDSTAGIAKALQPEN